MPESEPKAKAALVILFSGGDIHQFTLPFNAQRQEEIWQWIGPFGGRRPHPPPSETKAGRRAELQQSGGGVRRIDRFAIELHP